MIMSLTSISVTRFPVAVNNSPVGSIFNNIRVLDPTQYHTFFDDFDAYVAANWTVTETDSGATEALANGDGGLLLLTNTAADNDLVQLVKVGESFSMEAGKELYFRTRFKVSNATQSDVVVGLQVTNTDGSGAVTDGLYFFKADDATSISVVLRKNATTGSTTAVVTTMADDTFIVLEAYYDGVDRLYYGYNGNVVGYLDASSTFLPDTTLAPMMEIKNGNAVARTMTMDYLFAAKARYSL
jgi:hypothetical protein